MQTETHLIYFSPTGTTRDVLNQFAQGLGAVSVVHHDLTRQDKEVTLTLDQGLAVIGVPVYAGRIPEIFLKRIEKLSGNGVPAVLVVLYGNRAFEDALVELRDVVTAKGFHVVASGAFIGEHSFSTSERPVALNRPDGTDLEKAKEFGSLTAQKLQKMTTYEPVAIPGNIPYKASTPLGGICPETDSQLCTRCKICSQVCPTFVITVNDEVLTKADGCLMCCACVKSCPQSARTLNHPNVTARRDLLVNNFSDRKEPSLYL